MEMEHSFATNAEKLAAFLRGDGSPADKMILALAWYAGLTAAQIAELKWADMEESAACLHMAERTIPLMRRSLPAPEQALKDALETLLQEGKLRKEAESGQYLAPGIQTDWERVKAVLAEYQAAGKPLGPPVLAREVGLKSSIAWYYLQRAQERRLGERIGRGAYRCL